MSFRRSTTVSECNFPGLGVECRGRLPVGEFHFCPGREEQGEFAAFRSQPEPVLAAIGVHVRVGRAVEGLVMDPAKARAFVTGGG